MTVVLGSISGVVTTPSPSVIGDKLCILCSLTFSSTYKTGGDTTLATEIETILKETGRGSIDWVKVDGCPGYVFTYNYETSKLQLFRTGAAVKGVLEELPEEEYPALVRTGSKPRLFAIGR